MKNIFQEFTDAELLATGILTPRTLKAYRDGLRRPRPVTVIALAQALGKNWAEYLP